MSILRLQHRSGGAAGSPGTANRRSGEVALNFQAGALEFWAFDGTNWVRVNPPANVTSASLNLGGAAGATTGMGAAWTALGVGGQPTASIIVASFGGTSYIKTGAGGADADWSAIGSAMSFATQAEVTAGTVADKAIAPNTLAGSHLAASTGATDAGRSVKLNASGLIDNSMLPKATAAEIVTGTIATAVLTPAGLRGASLMTPSGTPANDANHLVVLNANGKLDDRFLSITALRFTGTLAPTAAVPAGATGGDLFFANADGALHAGFGLGAIAIKSGDALIYDGTAWHAVPNTVDLTAYVPLAGGVTMASLTAKITWPTATPGTEETFLDMGGGKIDNVLIDLGTF